MSDERNPFDALDAAQDMAEALPALNPFDALDDEQQPVVTAAPFPRPSLVDRFAVNFAMAQRGGTLSGAIADYKDPQRLPEERVYKQDRAIFDAEVEDLPQWETPLEGLFALGGQIAGGAAAPENFVPIGFGAAALEKAGVGLSSIGARVFAGAVDAGAINAVTDAGIQGLEIKGGRRDEFSGTELAKSTAIGALAGGALHGAIGPRGERTPPADETLGDRYQRLAEERGVAAPPAEPTPAAADVKPEPAPELAPAPAAETSAPATPEAGVVDLEVLKKARDTPHELTTEEANAVISTRVAGARPLEAFNAIVASGVRGQRGNLIRDIEALPHEAPAPDVTLSAKEKAEGRTIFYGGRFITPAERDAKVAEMKAQLADLDEMIAARKFDTPDRLKIFAPAGEPGVSIRELGPHGPVADGFDGKWREAVTWLKQWEGGEAIGALDHPEVGKIDVPWGFYDARTGNGAGLAKILAKHPEAVADLAERLRDLPVTSRTANRIRLADDQLHAVVRLDYDGAQKTWLLTAFEPEHRRGGGRTERPAGRQKDTSSSSPADDNLGSIAADVEGLPLDLGGAPRDFLAAQSARLRKPRGAPMRPVSGVASTPDAAPAMVRLRDVSNALIDAIDPAAARQGRFSIRGKGGVVMGQYSARTGVVRVRNIGDFDTLTHELGHHLEVALGTPLQPVMKAFKTELEPLAYVGADPRALLKEGFAEYVRLMATNPAYAANAAPGFDAAFRTLMAKERPDLLSAIGDAQAAYRAYLDQPSQQAVASTIVSAKLPTMSQEAVASYKKMGLWGTVGDYLGRAYMAVFDEAHPVHRATRDLARIAMANRGGKPIELKVSDDPGKLVQMLRGAASAAHMDILYGTHGYKSYGQPVSASLRDALIEATGAKSTLGKLDEAKLHSFGSYLWSRRAVGEWDRFLQGEIPNPPDKLTLGDHVKNVRELEAANPAFVTAAAKVHDYAQAQWAKKFAAGLITREQFDEGLKIVDYVPGQRHFEPDERAGGGKAGDARADQVKRFRGSTRDVVNPIDSLIADTYQTTVAIARNDAIKALDRLARTAGPGSGRIAERIPSHQLKGTAIDPLEAIASAGKAAGLSPIDVIQLRDAVEANIGDAQATIFRPAVTSPNGEPIVFFREAGEIRALQLSDGPLGRQLMGVLNAPVGPMQRDLVNGLLARGAGILRAGVTTDPTFALANFFRDQVQSIIYYGQPFKRIKATLQGGADELFSREAARQYNAAAGIMGGANTAALRDTMVKRDLAELTRKGYVAKRFTSIKGLLETTEIAETAGRLGLFRTFYDAARKRGLADDEAILEAAWRSRDYMDFDRSGAAMKFANRTTPFLNAALQGSDKFARHMIAPLFRKAVTQDEVRAKNVALGSWARLSVLVAAGVAHHAVMSRDEDYRELSEYTRATHWAFKTGDKFFVVPKPFEAIPFLALGEAAWDAMALRDPKWSSQFLASLANGAPPLPYLDNPLIKTWFEHETGVSMFTDAPIVPDTLKALEPQLQYTAATSTLAKQIGKEVGYSPILIDHLLFNTVGSWGRSVASMSDWAAGDKPAQGWDDAVFLRRFIKDASRGAKSTTAFWNLVASRTGALEGKALSYKAMMDSGDVDEADKLLGGLEARERAYVTVSMLKADVKRVNPLLRARAAVQAIGALRRQVAADQTEGADGPVKLTREQRGQADDILSDLAMAEARNALVDAGEPGWAGRKIVDTSTYADELKAVSPELRRALADRYATGKVLPAASVRAFWPELQERLLKDGTDALTADLVAGAGAQGFELEDGRRIGRKARPKVRGAE